MLNWMWWWAKQMFDQWRKFMNLLKNHMSIWLITIWTIIDPDKCFDVLQQLYFKNIIECFEFDPNMMVRFDCNAKPQLHPDGMHVSTTRAPFQTSTFTSHLPTTTTNQKPNQRNINDGQQNFEIGHKIKHSCITCFVLFWNFLYWKTIQSGTPVKNGEPGHSYLIIINHGHWCFIHYSASAINFLNKNHTSIQNFHTRWVPEGPKIRKHRCLNCSRTTGDVKIRAK